MRMKLRDIELWNTNFNVINNVTSKLQVRVIGESIKGQYIHKNVKYQCDIMTQILSIHKMILYPCNYCNYKANRKSNLRNLSLKRHKRRARGQGWKIRQTK